MLRCLLRAKLHMARITEANLMYIGSLAVDEDLMDLADLAPYEKIMVSNMDNGERFDTYIIPAPRGSGEICINGAAARKGMVGDRLIVFAFAYLTEEEVKTFKPKVVILSENNKPVA